MSEPIRRESHPPVPRWSPDEDPAQEPIPSASPEGHADWLLLLPIAPGAVALDLGCGLGALSLDIAQYCDRVVAVDPDPECASATHLSATRAGLTNVGAVCSSAANLAEGRKTYDLLVVQNPGRIFRGMPPAGAVTLIAGLVRGGGCVAIAVGPPPAAASGGSPGPRGSARFPYWGGYGAGHLRRLLARSGFADIRLMAAVPDAYKAEGLVPVAGGPPHPGVPGSAAARSLWPSRTPRQALLRATAALSWWGAVRALAPAFWIIARAPGSLRATQVEEVVRSIVARPPSPDSRRTDPVERARIALRARMLGFLASGEHADREQYATLLAVPVGWHEPACVVRVQRRRGGESLVGAQQDLARLRGRLAGRIRDSIPAQLGAVEVGGHHAAAEEYLGGRSLRQVVLAMGRRGRRRAAQQALPAIGDWLAELHEQTCACTWIEGDEAAGRIRRTFAPAGSGGAGGITSGPALDALAAGIARAGTRLGVAHNRLDPSRVLLRPGGIAVTGWEHLSFEDLPLLDLLRVAGALGGLLVGDDPGAAVDPFCFTWVDDTWYSREVRATVVGYCRRIGIAAESLPLYLAFGTLRAALVDPLADVGQGARAVRLAQLALQPGRKP